MPSQWGITQVDESFRGENRWCCLLQQVVNAVSLVESNLDTEEVLDFQADSGPKLPIIKL